MDRPAWTSAFILELQQLRPHLSTKVLEAMATMHWPSDKDRDPKGAALHLTLRSLAAPHLRMDPT